MKQAIYSIIFLVFVFIFTVVSVFAQIQVSTLVEEIDASGGVKVDAYGNVVVADFGEALDNANGKNVWKVTPEGEVSLFATGLFGASGNAFDSKGNLFQSSIGTGTVSKITPDGNLSFFATSGISCNVGIAIDPDDNLYVCNCCGNFVNTIRKVTPTGTSSLFASGDLFSCPNGITIDKDNNLYVSNFGNGNIIKITPAGTISLFAQTPGTAFSVASNGHITYSPQEDVLYVASHSTHNIYRLEMDGTIEIFAGSSQRGNEDGAALEATFSRPNGLALSHTGDTLYVNSSIPTTDAGGRPLNPSKVRMITGLLHSTSIDKDLAANFAVKISPNPAKNVVQIAFEKMPQSPFSVKLLNASGQLVKSIFAGQKPLSQEFIEVDLKEMTHGLYYVQFEVGNRSFIRKVILQ
ncbi:MAG: T9SS type A sorting domain-containing protein [Chitinophagales bacterium]